MNEYFHSVRLDKDKCKGCTNCIKRCPTQAIRVRAGKAHIINERCIDCGECIRLCPHKAKKAVSSKLEKMDRFKWKIALPAPSLYGQFDNLDDVDYVLPGNDDAVRSIKVVLGALTNAIIEANGGTIVDYVGDEDKKPSKEKTFVEKEKKEQK